MNANLRAIWQVAKTPLRIATGVVLILVGIVGLILPVMPGWVFIFPGVAMLAPRTPLGRWLRKQARRLRTWLASRRSPK